ncbi:MAG: glycosyltransferase [Lachnospiraceae bacterium]|nr:glycosyltransferase [Lachnospiraceae bacterium]
MKLISFAVPCYNSAAYMEKCIESLLKGGEDVEINIVDDGSSDNTLEIAKSFEERYPTICHAIHQENKGHGGAVNTGLAAATGRFFKVVDSDDWLDETALSNVIAKLKELSGGETRLDVLVCNYVYEKEGETHKKVINYRHALPVGRLIRWNEVGHFKKGQYILMHSVIFRTGLLKECALKLPEHTFYVDNLFIFKPLPNVENLYYMDEDLYRYFIGRADQSVNEKVMIKRIDQQLRVNKEMFEFFGALSKAKLDKRLWSYMYAYLDIITTVSSILMYVDGSKENLKKKKEFWNWMKKTNEPLYRRLRHGIMGWLLNIPGKFGRVLCVFGYKVAQKIFHFN